MNLTCTDDKYREYSIKETLRVIDITRSRKKFIQPTKRSHIIANISGFTMSGKLPSEFLPEYYERFFQSFRKLDLEGVELNPQTTSPLPWHFGGQSYQNIFVQAEENR